MGQRAQKERSLWIGPGAASAFALFSAHVQTVLAAPETPVCELEPGPAFTVTKIIDSETIGLENGREVRLTGALGPKARDAGASSDRWPPEQDALAALTALALGKPAKLAFGGERTDRYGRYLAHVFVKQPSGEVWLQGEMLSLGMARAYAVPANTACGRELLARERAARENQIGLWGNPLYRAKTAEKPGFLLSLRNHFERVAGTVALVSKTKTALYLNFGSDWKTDFTARIAQPVLDRNQGFEDSLLASKDKNIVVRGWIERRNGPFVDIVDPSQIEGLDVSDEVPLSQVAPGSGEPPVKVSPASRAEKPGQEL